MTCFWDGIIAGIRQHRTRLPAPRPEHWTPTGLVIYLKAQNQLSSNVLYNGEELSSAERQSNFDYILNFDFRSITHGYICSASDPFLLLLGQLTNLTEQ
jgi:hypothetical protein